MPTTAGAAAAAVAAAAGGKRVGDRGSGLGDRVVGPDPSEPPGRKLSQFLNPL